MLLLTRSPTAGPPAHTVVLRASWINHQCQPNCVVVFEGLTLHLHTLQNMLMDGSCEVCTCTLTRTREGGKKMGGGLCSPLLLSSTFQLYISYVDMLEPRSKRQEALLSGWYFTCQCPRCTEVRGRCVLGGSRYSYCLSSWCMQLGHRVVGHTCRLHAVPGLSASSAPGELH